MPSKPMPTPRPSVASPLFAMALAMSVGCGAPSPEFAAVTGVVKVKGKPAVGVYVRFLPDPDKGNDLSASSSAESNEKGEFELTYYYQGQEGPGAAVGWHRVILEDTRLSSIPQGAPLPPPLFSARYSSITHSPLSVEVLSGEDNKVLLEAE